MSDQEQNQKGNEEPKHSYWEVFMDDIYLLFFLGAAIMFILYTVWGLTELASIPVSPLAQGLEG